jgi:hypothetical protein
MWLLFAWLLAEPHLHKHAGGIAGSAYELSQDVGPIWTGIAVGAAAYLVGAISQSGSAIVRRTVSFLPYFTDRRPDLELMETIESAVARGQEVIYQRNAQLGEPLDRLNVELHRRANQAVQEVDQELNLPATLLIGEQNELFAEVDRLRAEGELRMAVVPPLLALTALLTLRASPWWLLLIPAVATLCLQGLQKELDSRKLIADATRIGRVGSSSVSKFSKWVDEALPEQIDRLRAESVSGQAP